MILLQFFFKKQNHLLFLGLSFFLQSTQSSEHALPTMPIPLASFVEKNNIPYISFFQKDRELACSQPSATLTLRYGLNLIKTTFKNGTPKTQEDLHPILEVLSAFIILSDAPYTMPDPYAMYVLRLYTELTQKYKRLPASKSPNLYDLLPSLPFSFCKPPIYTEAEKKFLTLIQPQEEFLAKKEKPLHKLFTLLYEGNLNHYLPKSIQLPKDIQHTLIPYLFLCPKEHTISKNLEAQIFKGPQYEQYPLPRSPYRITWCQLSLGFACFALLIHYILTKYNPFYY